MKILVTGATGFIGGNLVKELVKKRYDVIALVRKTSKTDSLKKLGVRFVVCDMMDFKSTTEVFDRIQPDIVIHSAAQIQIIREDEDELHRVNITITRNIAQSCLEHSVKRLVYLSSVAVVSGNNVVPIREGLPYKASDAYGRSKIEAEKAAIDFRNKGLNLAIIRPCMVYGEGEPHMLDTIFEGVKKKKIPLLNIAGIDSKLHLGYISNIVDALMLAIEKDEAVTGTFMVADKEIITVRKFIEILYDEIHHKKPVPVPEWVVRLAMVLPSVRRKIKKVCKDRVYDISRAQNLLGYNPKVSTEDGLRMTVKHWKGKHSGQGIL